MDVAKIPISVILKDSLPNKSKNDYTKRWALFRAQMGLSEETIPNEEAYLRYFYWLRQEKKYKASSCWTVFGLLNGCHKRYYGKS
jgi:hypothetical protein